ncbi:MAG: YcaO-like family protein [Pseudonocardiaceae bacterium]
MCTLEGVAVHAWLTRLHPFLTGDHTLDELIEVLPAGQRDMVVQLVRVLHEGGFVVDARADRAHSLSVVECQAYAEEIGFVRYSLDSAEYRFQCYRRARVMMLGDGPVLTALLDAGLRSGLCDVRVVGCGPAQVPQLREVVRWACRDGDQDVVIDASALVVGGGLAAVVEASEVVLQVCGPADWADCVAVARECGRVGTVLGQVLVDREEAWIAPVGCSGAESGWRRLSALRSPWPGEDAGEGVGEDVSGPAGWLTGPVPAVLAAQLALGCFRHLTGMDELPRYAAEVSEPVMTRVDLRTLDTRTHSFLAHPLAQPLAEPLAHPLAESRVESRDVPGEPGFRVVIEAYVSGSPIEPGELLERGGTVVDARCGLFGRLDEDELTQLPLWVCRASVSDPCALLPGWAPAPVVTGHGLDREEARLRALLAAFAVYGSLVVDRRRLTGGDATDDAALSTGVWGMDLVTGRPRTVPALAGWPALGGVVVPYRSPVGAAAGVSWDGAVLAALGQHCERLLAGRLAVADRPCPWLDPDQFAGDERVSRLLRLLAAAREPVEVYDLRGVLGLPACAVLAGGATVALTCGATMVDAVGTGLGRALLSWQARRENQPDYAPPVVAQLAGWLRAPALAGVTAGSAGAAPPPTGDTGVSVLVGGLRAVGYTPVAVPLDHDPEATRILPYVVQVVLCRD